ncbi:hypothetical protein HPB52_004880 [Rhipicephalus sanguineus]|uniref:Glucose-methanol-choline oxidoreductase N-terminal domain-containing protein n=1 Tax=Rhipicephalus sanguineus TaxID=34632 RepID=A0A9D4PIC7_RHISA|nr:hypothetical protein HPB52_004880 [Rhipicephalus sanguineus]
MEPPKEPEPETPILYTHYDYVIVGGGSAGCVLANRLSADPSRTVLLIEAGQMEENYTMFSQTPLVFIGTQVPLFAPLLIGSEIDWQYITEPQQHACLSMVDQRCPWARGKVMGGSSAINFMLYVRGNRRDYDIWKYEFGAHGWSYEDVLPHFIKIENSSLPDHDQAYRGTAGEIPVMYASTQTTLGGAFLEACMENGYPIVDYNGESQAGLGAGGERAPGLFAVTAASRACSGGEAVAAEGADGEPVGLLSAVETAEKENAGRTYEHEEGEGNS